MTLKDPRGEGHGKSSVRHFYRKKKAFGHARYLGSGSVVVQLNPHCGHKRKLGLGTWLTKEWEIVNEQEL
jgi:hypothetical protein